MKGRRKAYRRALLFLVIFAPALFASFDAKAETVGRRVLLDGEIFVRYLYDLSYYRRSDPRCSSNDYNAFDLTRAELGVEGIATPGLAGRLLIEADRLSAIEADTDGDGQSESTSSPDYGRLELIFKNVFIDWRPYEFFSVRAGMIPSVYFPAAENAWTMRYVEKVAAHRFGYFDNEADLGLGIYGDFPRRFASYELQVTNGEGYKKEEKNRYKAGSGRITLNGNMLYRSLGPLSLTVAGRYAKMSDRPGPGHDRRTSLVALLAWRGESLFAGLSAVGRWWDYSENADPVISRGGSFYAGWIGPYRFGPFFRYDFRDPRASNDHGADSIVSSKVGAEMLPSDEDEDHSFWLGIFYRPTGRFDIATYYYMRMFEEKYPSGDAKGDIIDAERQARLSLRLSF